MEICHQVILKGPSIKIFETDAIYGCMNGGVEIFVFVVLAIFESSFLVFVPKNFCFVVYCGFQIF